MTAPGRCCGRTVVAPGPPRQACTPTRATACDADACPPLSPAAQIVRTHDPDRFLTALFAPPAYRETLFTLYAFNHELARAREAVREPMAALIRLQWWREIVEGARRRHEVATPLGQALDDGTLDPTDLMTMIDAREAETEPIPTLAAFEIYVLGTAGTLMVAAARTLGMTHPEALRQPGAACGIVGALRNLQSLARQGRAVLPQDLLHEAGLSLATLATEPPPATLAQVTRPLRAKAAQWLQQTPPLPRPLRAATLPMTIARRDLNHPGQHPTRPLMVRVAVMTAMIRGAA